VVVTIVLGLILSVSPQKRRLLLLTQHPRMIQKARINSPALAMKGALLVPVTCTNHSLDTPASMATTLLRVVMIPNMLLKLVPALSSCLLWYSVTIQLSKALNIRLVLSPPKTLPKNSTGTLETNVEKQEMEYMTQNTRHAVFRPYRSANWPTK
jgi:hypothetical protein